MARSVRPRQRVADLQRDRAGGDADRERAVAAQSAGPLVTLWLDDHRAGTGYRMFVLLRVGHKHAHLFHWPTMTRLKLPKEVLTRSLPVAGDPARVRRLIKETIEVFKRVGREVPEVTVGEALDVLRGART